MLAQASNEALVEAWREYFKRAAVASPPHPEARDFMGDDLRTTLRRFIPDDASVLEVGCGTGALLAALPNRVRVGIDLLPELIAEARKQHPDVDFQVGDATQLGERGSFDAIVCDRLCHSVLDI